MSNLEMWSLVVGFFMPLVIAAVQRSTWQPPLRALVALIMCIIASLGTVWFAGEFNTDDVISSILLVLVTSISTYKGLWKPTAVAPKIEAATSPGPTPNEEAAG
jgi:ABC-type uncharacterized transport system permease subunit